MAAVEAASEAAKFKGVGEAFSSISSYCRFLEERVLLRLSAGADDAVPAEVVPAPAGNETRERVLEWGASSFHPFSSIRGAGVEAAAAAAAAAAGELEGRPPELNLGSRLKLWGKKLDSPLVIFRAFCLRRSLASFSSRVPTLLGKTGGCSELRAGPFPFFAVGVAPFVVMEEEGVDEERFGKRGGSTAAGMLDEGETPEGPAVEAGCLDCFGCFG